jgi:hypothetical protein
MTRVTVATFRPFRDGREVVGLSFTYDGELIYDLKLALQDARDPTTQKTAGGWLRKYRRWFVEPDAWPFVRHRLIQAGYWLDEQDPQVLTRLSCNF